MGQLPIMDDGQKAQIAAEVLELAVANGGWLPTPELVNTRMRLLPNPAVEVALFHEGSLVTHRRTFTEWPGEYGSIEGLYLPGGYINTGETYEQACFRHLLKDGVIAPSIEYKHRFLSVLWPVGLHPYGTPESHVCVCISNGILSFEAGKENDFQLIHHPVETQVPMHTLFIKMAFDWLNGKV